MSLPLLGSASCVLDSKRRLTLPAKLREELGLAESGSPVVITIGQGGCLYLFTPETWNQFSPPIFKAVIQGDPKAIRLRTLLAKYGSTPRTDRNGRVSLTEGQMGFAGIQKQLVVFPSWNRVELWSPERFEATYPSATSPAEVDELMAHVDASVSPRKEGDPPA
ncbi:MAG: hypothetical protein GF330_11435 [Candidatus Eisenbacteria bacterium]|nr:hypothetical protein [Candidatus Eisenbacteria bacterium]